MRNKNLIQSVCCVLLACSVSPLSLAGECTASGQFAPWQPLQAEDRPWDVCSHDFNQDGIRDIASVNWSAGTVSVFVGHGDGNFTHLTSVPAGSNPNSIAAGDFTGSPHIDLAISSLLNNGTIHILEGTGDGLFSVTTSVRSVGSMPTDIQSSDLNGDQLLDLFYRTESGCEFLLGETDGVSKPIVAEFQPTPTALEVIDVQGDSTPEFLTANADDTISVLSVNTEGAVSVVATLAAQNQPRDVGAADIDGDGLLDIYCTNRLSNSISIFRAVSDGVYGLRNDFPTFELPLRAETADLNADGIPDLVVSHPGAFPNLNEVVNIHFGNQSGGIDNGVPVQTGLAPLGIELADFTDDEAIDIVVANSAAANNGQPASSTLSVILAELECPCPADLDADQDLDFFDISAFLVFYQLGDLTVDFTDDGVLNFFDVSAFLNAFNAGCP